MLHGLGWREWALSDGSGAAPDRRRGRAVSTALGVLGMPGFTAWYGLFELGQPKEGETVFVSGAAGAVGSAAGQMAKIAGCRVIGSAGSEEKLAWLRELGFDGVFNYREQRRARRSPSSRRTASTSTSTTSAATTSRPRSARCGRMAASSRADRSRATTTSSRRPGPRNMFMVVTKRLRIQGYIISDHFDRFGEFCARRRSGSRDGRLRYRETVIDGIENAPKAFLGLLRGENIGKMLVKVGPCGVKLRCRVFGHRLPRRRRPFFLTERYQRCERCGRRMRLKDR